MHADAYKLKKKHKLDVRWRGPYRITKVTGPSVFQLQHLIRVDDKFVAHATRLKYYSDELDVDEVLLDSVRSQDNANFIPEKILDARFCHDTLLYEVHVSWLGFSLVDATWEPFTSIVLHHSKRIRAFVTSLSGSAPLRAELEALLEEYQT